MFCKYFINGITDNMLMNIIRPGLDVFIIKLLSVDSLKAIFRLYSALMYFSGS